MEGVDGGKQGVSEPIIIFGVDKAIESEAGSGLRFFLTLSQSVRGLKLMNSKRKE
jgi:hypothetical protein